MIYVKKGLVISAILILVGATFVPTINASVIKDDLVEFDVEFCGLGKKHTVKLTEQESNEVEQLFDDIEQRLSEVENREEAIEIFKWAIEEFNKFGLFGGISTQIVERLLIQPYVLKESFRSIDDIFKTSRESKDTFSNYFCLLCGRLTNTVSLNPLIGGYLAMGGTVSYNIFKLLDWLRNNLDIAPYLFVWLIWILIYGYGLLFLIPSYGVILLDDLFLQKVPLRYMNMIGIGEEIVGHLNPSEGRIISIGITGINDWTGDFYGNLPFPFIYYEFYSLSRKYSQGIRGFTGLKLYINSDEVFYLGSALLMKVSNESPFNN